MHHKRPNSRLAFTLIELLAVVAIILVLLSLLVPTLNGARLRGEFAVCKSNLRQIGAAAEMYATESVNNDFPYCWDWIDSRGGSYTVGGYWIEWGRSDAFDRGTIRPYLGGTRTDVVLCPTFAKVCNNNPGLPDLKPYASYDMNEYYRYTNGTPEYPNNQWAGYQAHRSTIMRPSQEGIFCEEDTWRNDPYAGATSWMNNFCFGTAVFDNKPQGPGGEVRDALGSFHLPPDGNIREGFSNVWCADGHVEKAHPSQSKDLMTPYFVKRDRFPAIYQ